MIFIIFDIKDFLTFWFFYYIEIGNCIKNKQMIGNKRKQKKDGTENDCLNSSHVP